MHITLKVRSGIKGRRNVAFISRAITNGFKRCADTCEALQDGSQQMQARSDILVRRALLDNGRNNGNINSGSRNCQGVSNAADEDIVFAAHLWTGDDNLHRLGIGRVGNGMVENANASNKHARGLDLFSREIRRISNDHACLGHLLACLDTSCLALIIINNLINILIQHIGTSVNGTDTRESLGKTSQSVDRINVGARSVSSKRVAVRSEVLDGGSSRLVHVTLVQLKAHGMRNELMCFRKQTKVLVKLPHGHCVEVTSLMRFRIGSIVLVHVNDEFTKPTLLKKSHERRPESLVGSGRDLENLAFLVDIRSADRFEFQITSDLSVNQHLGEVSVGHDKLGDEIHIVITVGSEVNGRLSGLELLE
mmetsp:Transcript_17757/g.41135  ORF Transcript_17757/g.41135 Transcript_17757/m.41135 type:complete len:365 (+) Transcript_17757:145-1239(+)